MVPIAAPYSSLRSVEGAVNTNPMLSLSSYPFQLPFYKTQHGVDAAFRAALPPDKTQQYSNWLTTAKDSYSNVQLPGCDIPKSTHNHQINDHQHESIPKLDNAKSAGHSDGGLNDSKVPCVSYTNSMNGSDNLVMTGSSNARAEQLSWLAEVAASSARAGQNSSPTSPAHEKTNGPSLLHGDCHTPRSSMNPILLGVSSLNQRVYVPYHAEGYPNQQSAAGMPLYYSQASRTAPFPSFYHGEHRLPCSQVVADGVLSQGRLTRPYYQEIYSPSIARVANIQLPSNHGSLPHSPSYLHPTASLSPVGLANSPPHQRMQQNSILASRSTESLLVQDQDKTNPSLRNACTSPQYVKEEAKKSYKSPEPKHHSPSTDAPAAYAAEVPQHTSSSHLTYRVPTGKEGSLKHRILRPPSINILDPPPAVLDAPLSAPPIRSHAEHSPKQLRLDTYGASRSFSTSGTFVLEASHAHTQPKISAQSFLAPSATVTSSLHSLPDCSSQLKYPPAFMKGSIIQLANSQLKPVELMTTEDFLQCETMSSNLKIDSSTVISIEKMPSSGSAKLGFSVGQNKLHITVEAPLEHPFFVYKAGWSSCCPQRSLLRYGLSCSKLKVGDTCIFLTVKNDQQAAAATKTEKTGPTLNVPTNLSTSKTVPRPSKLDTVVKTEKKPQPTIANVPSLQKLHLPTSVDAKDTIGTPKKRKRRWSAPSEVSNDCPASD